MTVPPPPAVPGELIETLRVKVKDALRGTCGSHEACRCDAADRVVRAVYGDIVEAARRDALTGAMEGNALARAVGWDDGYLQGRRDALTEAIARYDAEHEGPPGRARAILTDLRSAP